MLEEYAIITACQGQQATLEIERRTACGLCGQKRGCGNATWGKLLGHDSQAFSAQNPINAKVGDSVVVGIQEGAMFSTSLYLYGAPLLGLFIGTMLTNALFTNQLLVMLGALLGLLLGFLWAKGHLIGSHHAGLAYQNPYQAVILRLAENDTDSTNHVLEKCTKARHIAIENDTTQS